MTPHLRVSLAQLCSGPNVDANLSALAPLAARAVAEGAQLLLLPECFAYLGPDTGKAAVSEPIDGPGPIATTLQRLSAEHHLPIVAGGFPESSTQPTCPFNSIVLFEPDAPPRSLYRKLHLFDVTLPDGRELRESATTTAGTSAPTPVELAGRLFGLSICYDVRFPELYRQQVQQGAEAFLVPSAFTLQTGMDHWELLLRARAVENQAWVVAANQWGSHGAGRNSYGHSMIIDPWGTVVARHAAGTGLLTATLDFERQDRIRRELPALQHRRL